MTSKIGVKKIQYPNGTDILTLDSSGSIAIADSATVGGTLGVTGATTLSSTLNVTGATTTAQINASGSINTTANTISVTNSSYPQLQLNSGVKNYHIFNDTGSNSLYFKNNTDNVNGMIVNASGHVSIPIQPAVSFQGTSNGNTTVGNGDKFGSSNDGLPAFTTSSGLRAHLSSSGITYNSATGVFTVSTAGKYLLYFQAYNNGGVVTSTRVGIYHNNTQMMLSHSPDLSYGTIHVNFLANASANDYFDFRHESGANRDFFHGPQHLGGYIVKVA